MAILLGLVLALVVLSGLDKLLWASSYEDKRAHSRTDGRTAVRHTGGNLQARSGRRGSPARGWLR